MLKTLEKIIDREIRETHLNKNPLHVSQHAYQRGKGTESALHSLVNKIETGMNQEKGIALVVFLDIAGAFDNTGHETIKKALVEKKVSRWIINWISEMLKSRKIKAKNFLSEIEYNPTRGCPQGGCLSPLLWSLVMDQLIIKLDNDKIDSVGYADDLAVISYGKDKFMNVMADKLNRAMNIIESWCSDTKLKVHPDKTYMMKFHSGRKEPNIKQIRIYNKPIIRVKTLKYLGVIFDEKNNWNAQLEYVIDKGKRTLRASRAMVSKKWGLSPKAMHWIYKQIVIPRITYASVIWWKVTSLKTNAEKLRSVHRLALTMITGATRSTPSMALEALLNMIPLDIKIREMATRACHRLKSAGTWIGINKGGDCKKHKQIEEQIARHKLNEDIDACDREWNEGKRYKVLINERRNWSYSLNVRNNLDCWYTDGSVRDGKTGIGIYNSGKKQNVSKRLSDHSTIMQAEVIAIRECARICLKTNCQSKDIIICVDSQAALKSLDNGIVNKKTTKTCKDMLNLIAINNRVTLVWVPGHSEHKGNEAADRLAAEATRKNYIDLKSEVPAVRMEERIEQESTRSARIKWNESKGMEHAKKYIRGFEDFKAKWLLKQKKNDVRVITGILTGHGLTNSYLLKINKAENEICRLCNEEDETVEHWIKESPATTERLTIIYGDEATNDKDQHYKSFLTFAKYYREIYDSFTISKDDEADNK